MSVPVAARGLLQSCRPPFEDASLPKRSRAPTLKRSPPTTRRFARRSACGRSSGRCPMTATSRRAPLVLLVGTPACEMSATRRDAQSVHRGWPLSGLHPHAPATLRSLWHARLAGLIEAFGAQHVANSVAALPLTPWACDEFDERLRLPSRHEMLALAAGAASRGALLLVTGCDELWTECARDREPLVGAAPPSSLVPGDARERREPGRRCVARGLPACRGAPLAPSHNLETRSRR